MMQAGVHILIVAHILLHQAVGAVRRFEEWGAREYGAEAPAWTATALDVLMPVNWGILGVEIAVAMFLAVRQSRKARAGEASEYFFMGLLRL